MKSRILALAWERLGLQVGAIAMRVRGSIVSNDGPGGPMLLMVCMPVATAILLLLLPLPRSQAHRRCLSKATAWAHRPPEDWEMFTSWRLVLFLLWGVGHSRNHPFCFCAEDDLRSAFIPSSSQQIFLKCSLRAGPCARCWGHGLREAF